MAPLISIIVPVYNVEEHLEDTLRSLLALNYPNYEILLVDDGSVDRSGSICRNYSETYPNIFYFSQENAGVSAARNYGIRVAKGEYITFVDADDIVSRDMLGILSEQIGGDDLAVASLCGEELELGQGRGKKTGYTAEKALKILPQNTKLSYSACAKLFRTDICRRVMFDIATGILEDYLFVCEYILHCRTVICIDRYVYCYVNRAGSAFHSGFSLKRMQLLYSYQKSIQKVKSVYPAVVPYIQGAFLLELIELDPLVDENFWPKEKKEIRKRILRYCKGGVKGSLGQRLKIWMYKCSVNWYYQWMGIKRKQGGN